MNRLFSAALRTNSTPFHLTTPSPLTNRITNHQFVSTTFKRQFSTTPFPLNANLSRPSFTPLQTITPLRGPAKFLSPFQITRRQVHAFNPNTKRTPQVESTPEQQLQDFLGRTDHRPLSRVDQAAKQAIQQQVGQSNKIVEATGSGKFYLLSRVIFAFETWTIIFFTGAFGYYVYNVLQFREDSPWDIAVRMWENFAENSRQYRSIITGKASIQEYRVDILRDKLALNPDDVEAQAELKKLEEKAEKRARWEKSKAREEAKAAAEWAEFSTELLDQVTKTDGASMSDEELLALIRQSNEAKLLSYQLNGDKPNPDVYGEQAAAQSKRRHFQ